MSRTSPSKGGRGQLFFQSFATPGGRIFSLLLLLVIGICAATLKVSWADDIGLGALAFLLTLLGGKHPPRE